MSKLKYGMATASAIAAFVGVAGLSLPQVQAGDEVMGIQVSDFGTQRARIEFEVQKQECDTLKNSQPQAYEPCLQKARSKRDNLLTQAGSAPAGQGSQGLGSNQSQQQFSGQEEQGPIDKMTSAVKETVAEVKEKLFGASESQQQGQEQSMGQGQQGDVIAQHPLQQGFEAQQMQGQGSGQGGQSFGQQGVAQGQQGQQGQSDQGSFQGQQPQVQAGQGSFQGGQQPQGQPGQGSFQGAYSQQPQGQSGQGSFQGGQQPQGQPGQGSFGQQQGQSGQQGTGGTNAQFQSGGAQEAEHMDAVEYYKVLAQQQYGTLKQECDTLKQNPSVWEQCQQHAKSVRDKIAGMAEQGT